MNCVVCNSPVNPDRWAIGYDYCMSADCAHELRERASKYRLILVPKQGFTYVEASSPLLLDGKSSGRQ